MKRVLFVQLPPPRFSFQEPPTNIPLAAGFLMAALDLQEPRQFSVDSLEPDTVDVLADRGLCLEILRREPDVLALTLYVWNVERSLFLASSVKRRSPKTIIIVGGPEVTTDNTWVLQHPAVDLAVFGEGESRIVPLLVAADSQQGIEAIPGMARKDRKGKVQFNMDSPAPWEFTKCSYPYIDGKISPSRDGMLFLETMRGCPFKCRYCYYHKAFQGTRFYPDDCISKILDFAYAVDSQVRGIYLMDPTFNARKGFRKLLHSIVRRIKPGVSPRLHTELRADLLELDDVTLLKKAGLSSAEIGLQTITPEALRAAGRKGDPEKISRGVNLLKRAGIEVTTGIIVGLPKDSPQGFNKTLSWLKEKKAYSVVHPFVLSVLPGTDFRAQAEALGLDYNERPPYFVRSTPTFPNDEIRAALLECESVFNMEMDYIVPPSLVDSGSGVVKSIGSVDYISKWIVRLDFKDWRDTLAQIVNRATDPFTLWFRGNYNAESMITILSEFTNANPHAVVQVVLELAELPPTEFFQAAIRSAANPDIFLNRYYEPLNGEGDIININFHIIIPDPGSRIVRRKIARKYESFCSIVWELREFRKDRLDSADSPLLLSWSIDENELPFQRALVKLKKLHSDQSEEVLFRNPSHASKWKSLCEIETQQWEFPEKILIS
jgi:tRNA A37 methylthiotransferase MiaB